jgi:hypothetical protein
MSGMEGCIYCVIKYPLQEVNVCGVMVYVPQNLQRGLSTLSGKLKGSASEQVGCFVTPPC